MTPLQARSLSRTRPPLHGERAPSSTRTLPSPATSCSRNPPRRMCLSPSLLTVAKGKAASRVLPEGAGHRRFLCAVAQAPRRVGVVVFTSHNKLAATRSPTRCDPVRSIRDCSRLPARRTPSRSRDSSRCRTTRRRAQGTRARRTRNTTRTSTWRTRDRRSTRSSEGMGRA